MLCCDSFFSHNVGTQQVATEKQVEWYPIQCLNVAVYTKRLHKKIYVVGTFIDFISHRRNINSTNSTNTAIRLAHALVIEAIAEKIQAMNNVIDLNPLITKKHLTKTMKDLEDKLDKTFGTFITTIDIHMDQRPKSTTTTIINHSTHLQTIIRIIAHEFQQSNLYGLHAAALDILQRTIPPPMPQGSNQPPLCFRLKHPRIVVTPTNTPPRIPRI